MRRSPAAMLLLAGLAISGCEAAEELGVSVIGGMPEVDAIFAEYDRPDGPGCAVGIVRDGELIYRRGYGMADLEHGVPLDADSVFRIGSVSKQFTGMAVVLLAESGNLDLDDDIREWVPEMPDFGQTITIRHLLNHTSGIRDYLELMDLRGFRDADYYDADDLLQMLARQHDLNFTPGERFLYSNSGYFLLSVIVERASGGSLEEFAREHIFVPLGMTSSHFHDDTTRIVPRRAMGYARGEDGGFVISMTMLPIVGDGGVFTSINDLLRWEQNFYADALGEATPSLLDSWLQPGRLNDGTELDYGAGIRDGSHRGLRLVGHGGAFVGFRAYFGTFPDQRFSVMALCNLGSASPRRLAMQVAETQIGAYMGPAERPGRGPEAASADGDEADEFALPVADLRGYAGRYANTELDVIYDFEVRDGRLHFAIGGRRSGALLARSEEQFNAADWPVSLRFAKDSGGRVTGFLLDGRRVKNLWFARVD